MINQLQGNFGWFRRELGRAGTGPFLELGAGSGDLGRHLLRTRVLGNESCYTGLDLCPRPEEWPAAWPWRQEDLTAFPNPDAYPVVLANLILHQFGDDALAALGQRLAGCRLILACEPLRSSRAQAGLFAMNLLGINHVSRHDGRVSILAGFRGRELPDLLGLSRDQWSITIDQTPLGCYRMRAERRENDVSA